MSKTFTCRELGGVCDEKFSGNSLAEVMQQGVQHMESDDTHKEQVTSLAERSGENREQWMERMQRTFETKPEDK